MDSAIVVGAGSFGASIAWTLARRGVATTLIDQFEPGDPRASSGGEARLYRSSHGGDEEYTRLARRARELWRELEAETGERLLEETGLAWFAHRDDGWEAQSERVMRALEIPCERVADPAGLFPSFRGDDLEFVLLEPEAGAIRAARAVRALVADARAHGASVIRGRARPGEGGVEIDGVRRLTAGMVVWACGGWLPLLFPGLVQLRVTRQDVFFLDGGPEWRDIPCWVDYDEAMHGTGDLDRGVKVAPDIEGPNVSADDPLPDPDPDNETLARTYAQKRFPGLGAAALAGYLTCRYELSPDSNFIAAPHPFQDDWWIVGGGSGHGFKHGPALAERVVDAMLGGGPGLPERFALGERAPGRSFRTAGSGG